MAEDNNIIKSTLADIENMRVESLAKFWELIEESFPKSPTNPKQREKKMKALRLRFGIDNGGVIMTRPDVARQFPGWTVERIRVLEDQAKRCAAKKILTKAQ